MRILMRNPQICRCFSLLVALMPWMMILDYGLAADNSPCKKATTTYEAQKCLTMMLKDSSAKLDELTHQLLSTLHPSAKKAFQNANESWRRYLDDNCKAESTVFEGGTLEGLVLLSCKVRLTDERASGIKASYHEVLVDSQRSVPGSKSKK
jgi:uncharacterized protein YecT (DUF1311 family)